MEARAGGIGFGIGGSGGGFIVLPCFAGVAADADAFPPPATDGSRTRVAAAAAATPACLTAVTCSHTAAGQVQAGSNAVIGVARSRSLELTQFRGTRCQRV